ncbi:hypothetical protein AAFF_G00276350 [Aldrovandia affinis]|uniref:Uncharacterized protein n=1 Tax=Aldrovandia affinis TaxID=143900 RepID=A0AAD7RAS3_9TELE|nr:hypothetical protein AAFF_G00276350 [Aldrovandia affinis]
MGLAAEPGASSPPAARPRRVGGTLEGAHGRRTGPPAPTPFPRACPPTSTRRHLILRSRIREKRQRRRKTGGLTDEISSNSSALFILMQYPANKKAEEKWSNHRAGLYLMNLDSLSGLFS